METTRMLKRAVAGLAVAATLTAGAASTAFAADSTTTTATARAGALRSAIGEHRGQVLAAIADALGLPADTVKAELRAGKTVTQIAEEHGVSIDTVKSKLVAAADARIQQALTNGRITQAQADQLTARVPTAVDRLVTRKLGSHTALRHRARAGALAVVAKTLDMSKGDLRTELRSGKSIADVAAEKDVPLGTVTDALLQAAKARLAQAVTDGKLTQDRADRITQRLPQIIDRLEHRTFTRTGA